MLDRLSVAPQEPGKTPVALDGVASPSAGKPSDATGLSLHADRRTMHPLRRRRRAKRYHQAGPGAGRRCTRTASWPDQGLNLHSSMRRCCLKVLLRPGRDEQLPTNCCARSAGEAAAGCPATSLGMMTGVMGFRRLFGRADTAALAAQQRRPAPGRRYHEGQRLCSSLGRTQQTCLRA